MGLFFHFPIANGRNFVGVKFQIHMKTKNIFQLVLIALLSVAGSSCSSKSSAAGNAEVKTAEVTNPLPIKFGDPFILHASDGKYYMYGTSLPDGFEAYVSSDFVNWSPCGQVYKGGSENQWNVDCFWAPEVYERNGKYYMFYSANSRNNPTHELESFKIGVAVSLSPAGPFTDLYDHPVFEAEYPVIDANVYFDDDNNRTYLYFSRCCYKHSVDSELARKMKAEGIYDNIEESWVYGVEMKPDFSGIIGEPKLMLQPPTSMSDKQAEWESRSVTAREVNRRWTEGSFLFKHGDTYYMMYSANSYQGAYYAVGYATSKNPLGPFVKSDDNPVLQENLSKGGSVVGTGHNMVLTMPDGTMYCVYHARMVNNSKDRVVMIDKMEIDDNGKLKVDGPTTKQQVIRY